MTWDATNARAHNGHRIVVAGKSSRDDSGNTPFVETVAVDAWDAWFRWREGRALRDLTVDATWNRVATALVSVEPTTASAIAWKDRLLDAFHTWRLLPDERILASAGTGAHGWGNGKPVAVLNAAAFVRAPLEKGATFAQTAFEEMAALAVRALDNAMLLIGREASVSSGFRIGVTGLADALAMLGLDYDSVQGRALAVSMMRTLAQGCLRGSLQLARERAMSVPVTTAWNDCARARGLAVELIGEAARCGIRHARLTAITSQPRLALFANNIADALDPLPPDDHVAGAAAPESRKNGESISSPTDARDVFEENPQAPQPSVRSPAAQLELRGCITPWIDEPIDYPIAVNSAPNELMLARWTAMTSSLGLPTTTWRRWVGD